MKNIGKLYTLRFPHLSSCWWSCVFIYDAPTPEFIFLFRCHAEVLGHHVSTCDRMLTKANETQQLLEDMRTKYRYLQNSHMSHLFLLLDSRPAVSAHWRANKIFTEENTITWIVTELIPRTWEFDSSSYLSCISDDRSVKVRGQALQFECGRLVAEKKRLLEFAEVLERKLGYFDELEVTSQKFHTGGLQVR